MKFYELISSKILHWRQKCLVLFGSWSNSRYLNAKISTGTKGKKVSHDPEEGVRVSAPAATLFGLSALLLSISMKIARQLKWEHTTNAETL